ncbi:MAG: DUF11 domain-containing protein [Candidatus Kerfeldbacteria bacterium]|nr:DUF11 domain-containing protein [Candidatus Kerfeldbacteria bacterium]
MAIRINLIVRPSFKERLWKVLNVIVGVSTIMNVTFLGSILAAPRIAKADAPSPASTITATYNPTGGALSVSGQYTWTACDPDNDARIVGFALFIDGSDADANVGTPLATTTEALDGTGMHLADAGQPCHSATGSWSDNSHNATTNPILTTAPTRVCVVTYDVRTGVSTGSHSQIGSGSNRNTDNSYEKNNDQYSSVSCTSVPVPSVPNPPLGQSCGLDIGLVVDRSESIDSGEMSQMKTALTNFANAFTGTPTVFSLTSFATGSTLNRAFSRTPTQAAGDIGTDIPSVGSGYTNWDSGLARSSASFDPRPAKANLIVIATDGSPNRWGYPTTDPTFDWDTGLTRAIERANAIKTAGTRIVVVGIGEDTTDPATPTQKLEKMKAISGSSVATTPGAITTATDVIKVTDFSGIGTALSSLAGELCGGKILVQKQFDTDGDGQADLTGDTADPLLAGYSFDVNGAPSNPAPQTTGGTGSLAFDVLNGIYSVVETQLPPNTRVLDAQCVNGQQAVGAFDPNSRTVSGLTMGTDDTVSCTFLNGYRRGSLKVTKIVDSGTASADDFALTIAPDPNHVGSVHPINGIYVFDSLDPGPYTVSEQTVTGYHQVASTCDKVQVSAGQQAECAIHNARDAGELTVIKQVVNNNGGNNSSGDFTMHIKQGGVDAVTPFAGSASGVTKSLPAGTYTVSETGLPAGYQQTSVVCDGQSTNTVIVTNDDKHTCTITNDDVASSITLQKMVINNNGGAAGPNDFGLTVGGTAVTSGQTLSVNANIPIALNEAGRNGYQFVSLSGDAKCPKTLGGTVTLSEGEHIVCTITNDDIAPRLTVIKHVINNNGGNNVAGDFTIFVNGTDVSDPDFPGRETGTTVTLDQGAYAVNESGPSGYTMSLSAQCTGTIDIGQHKTCTVTNNDRGATVTLTKRVTNDNGGTAGPNDFGLRIGGQGVNSGQTLAVAANAPISISETGRVGYQFVSISGDTKCPPVLGGTVTLSEGEHLSCTITNDDVQPRLTVYKVVVHDDGGAAVPSDFTLNVTGGHVNPSQFAGSDQGTIVSLDAGDYHVTEQAKAGYEPVYSDDCQGSIAVGQNKACVVTNNDQAAHLIVIKHVVNDDGGKRTSDDFWLTIDGVNVPSGDTFPGAEAPGVDKRVHPGNYLVTEKEIDGYLASYSRDCSGSIALGETKVCTVTNDDVPPTITLIKQVINDDGGTAGPDDFGLTIGGQAVQSGQALAVPVDQPMTVDEVGRPGYAFVSLTGDKECPGKLGGTVSLYPGQHVTCTITNDDIEPQLTVTKIVINDNGGTAEVKDFDLFVDTTQVESGAENGFDAGTYTISEGTNQSGYEVTLGGDCNAKGEVTLNLGDVKHCTITNDDIAPRLTVIKHVVSQSAATKTAGDFTIFVNGVEVSDPSFPGDEGGTTVTLDTGAYFVDEAVSAGYLKSLSANCSGTIDIGQHQTCTITNTQQDFTVTVSKTDEPDPVPAGAELTYTVAWALNGNVPVDNLTVTDTLPTNTTFVSADQGGQHSNGLVTWSLGPFPTGNGSGSLAVTVKVASPLTDGTVLTNRAEICGQALSEPTEQTIERCDDDEEKTTVESAPAIDLDKSGPATAIPGDTITYTLAWSVSGNAQATNAIVSDPVPADASFVSASDDGGLSGSVVSWNLGTVNPGDSGTVSLTVLLDRPLPDGQRITNTGTFDTTENDPVSDTVVTVVESAPSLSITKTNDVAGFTNPGQQVTYTVVVSNAASATDTARNVVLTDILPNGFTYADVGDSTRTFSLDDITPGSSVTTIYNAAIDVEQAAGTYTNTASAQGSNTPKVSDRSEVDVRRPQVLGAQPEVDLNITKRVSPTVTNPGQVVTYTLTIVNAGDADATDVKVTDTLPNGFTFIEGGRSTKTFVIGTLAPNHQRVINYQVRIGRDVASGRYQNTAVLTSNETEPQTVQAALEVRRPRVLGLATTGITGRDVTIFALGFSTLALGLVWLMRLRRSHDAAAV